jgi:dipeptidyl aminopeptidase/acylaminoacyl peptidase
MAVLLLTLSIASRAEEGASETAGPRSITIDDYFALATVGDPEISPDGEWIAYTVTTRDLEENSSSTRLWMVSFEGGEPIPMSSEKGSVSRPRWSPDGKYLSFLATRDEGKSQVWTLFRQGGEAVQLTEVEQGVEAYEWSPDATRLALVIKDPKPENQTDEDLEGNEDKDEATPPWVVTRRQFKQDYVGYLDSRRTHVYVMDVAGKELRQLTGGDFDDSQIAWSPDGTRIAFTSNRSDDPDSNYNTDIWVIPADAAEPDAGLTRVTSNPGPDDSPAWSPDGTRIAHRSLTDVEAIVYGTNHLLVSPAGGGEPLMSTEALDRHVYGPRFSNDGNDVYFILEDSGEQILSRVPVDGGEIDRLVGGENVVEAFRIGPDGSHVGLISQPHLPREVFLIRGGRATQLTHTNQELLTSLRLGAVEEVQFSSADGTPIEGFIVTPPDFEPGTRYPTLLRIHGGPVAQYDWGFNYQAQLFAANGYVVLLPNPRGSSGYGQEFSLGIWRKWGGPDFEDVMAIVDHAVELGIADPDRLGVGGWSYGGMLTNHVITKTDRFKGAITGASAMLYVVNYGHDQYQRWWEYELGLPWENREIWEELSPFNAVDKVVTPTLIVGGEKDWNVPIINSEQLFLALKRLGQTAELVVYPGEYHGIGKPTYIRDLYQRYLDWYGRHVKGEPRCSTPNRAAAS